MNQLTNYLFLALCMLLAISCEYHPPGWNNNTNKETDSLLLWLKSHTPINENYREQLLRYKKLHPADYFRQKNFIQALNKQGEYNLGRYEADSLLLSLYLETMTHREDIGPCELPELAQSVAMALFVAGYSDSAEFYYKQAIQLNAACPNDTLLALLHMRLGNLYYRKASYQKALKELRNSLEISIRLQDSSYIESTRANMANVYMDLKNYDKSIALYEQSRKVSISLGNYQSAHTASCCLVNCYLAVHDTAQCLLAASKAIQLLDSLPGNLYARFYTYYSYGHALLKLKQYPRALFYLEQSIHAAEQLQNGYIVYHCKLLKASALVQVKEYHQAQKLLFSLLSNTEAMAGDPVFENDTRGVLAEAEEGMGHFEEALRQSKQHHHIKDSLSNAENAVQIAQLEKQYEQQEQETRLQQQEQELKTLKKDKRYLLLVLLLTAVISVLMLLVYNARKKRELLKKENLLKEHFSRELIANTEKERGRIARELHDGVASDLLLVHISANGSEQAKRIEQVINNIRNITHALFPVHLSKVRLAGALQSLVQNLDRETDIYFTLEEEDIPNVLSKEQELYAFRIAQEALNNIIKHARAKAVLVKLYSENQSIHLIISDNGIGFNEKKPGSSPGFGLTFMQQRAAHIGASISIRSTSAGGTKIHLLIPCA